LEYTYKFGEHYGPEDLEGKNTLNLLIIYADGKCHALLVTDPEKLTGYKSCPKCHNFERNVSIKQRQNEFDTHVEKCTVGVKEAQVRLDDSKPFAPHIQKNKTNAHFIARGKPERFKPTRYFECFDMESMEEKIAEYEENSTGTTQLSIIHRRTIAETSLR
jgi:hypothetical protein